LIDSGGKVREESIHGQALQTKQWKIRANFSRFLERICLYLAGCETSDTPAMRYFMQFESVVEVPPGKEKIKSHLCSCSLPAPGIEILGVSEQLVPKFIQMRTPGSFFQMFCFSADYIRCLFSE